MPNLPPPVWAELFYSSAWNTITDNVRVTTSAVTITRGLSSESSSSAEPTTCSCDLDSRDNRYGPRNPTSPLYGLIGRNTPMRLGYNVGSAWAAFAGGLGGSDAIETPDAAALDVTGDFDLRIEVALDNYAEDQMLACRYYTTGNNRCWALELVGGLLTFLWSPDGQLATRLTVTSTEALKAHNGQRLALRVTVDVDNGAGGHEVRFYTGRTVNDTEWSLLGSPVSGSAATTSIYGGTAPLEFGAGTEFNQTPAGGALNTMRGKAFALRLLNGIAGTAVVAMAVSAATVGGTSFVDSTGLTWTKQGAASFTNKHIRMSGEVPAWPPTRDLSLKDNYVSVTPAGVLRRMDAGNKPTDSALLRYIKAHSPIECWPLTDGKQTNAQGGASLLGGSDMTYQLTTGAAAPEWRGGRLADWTESGINLKAETTGVIKGRVPNSTSAAAAWSVDVFLSGGGQGAGGTVEINDLGAYTDADNRIRFQLNMDANGNSISVFRASLGETSSSSTLLASISSAGIFNDALPHHIRLTVDPGASDSTWAVYLDGVSRASGTMTGIVVKAVRDVAFFWSLVSGGGINAADQRIGFITYWDGTGPSAANMYSALTGFQGEKAGARIVRLATESGYTATVAGETVFQRPMGIQGSKKLLELMNEASSTNFGYLLDARDRTEVIHRGQSTLWNQPPALTLDFSAGLISPPFKPVDDDKLTENDVTVQREFGSVPARVVQETGALSVLAPENGGVGRYDQAYTYSLYTDAQAAQAAGMRVHLGTYAGVRYTRITLNLANSRVFALIDDILRLDVGDKIRLTNLPADHGPDAVDVLVAGYTESAGPDAWTITFNCVPGEPWNAGVADSSTYGRADTGGCQLVAALNASQTGVNVFTTGLARWINAAPVLNGNPGFDAGISGWAGTGATLTWDTSLGRRAPGCIVLTTNGAASPRGQDALVAVSANRQYTLSGWLRTEVALGTTANVAVNWYTAVSGGSFISTSSLTATLATGKWTYFEGTVTAPSTAAGAGVLTSLDGTPAAGLVWRADDLELREYVPDTYPNDIGFDVRTGGEVMRVSAAIPAVWDAFDRTVSSSWGTANSGQAWTVVGTAADYAVGSGYGSVTQPSVGVAHLTLAAAPAADVDLYVDVATSALATGASLFGGPIARAVANSDFYMARLDFTTAAGIAMTLRKRVANVESQLGSAYTSPLTHVAGTFYRVRMQVTGSALKAKVWLASDPEPVVWHIETTDTALTAAANVGTRSFSNTGNTNASPQLRFTRFAVVNPQTFTVTRSTNGVVKSHPSGQALSLASPVYAAM